MRYKSNDSHAYGKWNATAPIDSAMWGIQLIQLSDSEVEFAHDLIDKSENQLIVNANNIRSIHINDDIVWIGSDFQGLNRYNLSTGELKLYSHNPDDPTSISDNSIQDIYEDEKGILWLSTNGGINKFDPKTEKSITYRQSDGLPTNFIASILPGDGNK